MRAAWPASKAEAWLFHGTDRVDDALNQGFKMSAVSLKQQKYGLVSMQDCVELPDVAAWPA